MNADIEPSEPKDDPETKVTSLSLTPSSPTPDTNGGDTTGDGTTDETGGETGGDTTGETGGDSASTIESLADKLKRLQDELDATKRQKDRADKRNADLEALKKQREASSSAIVAAHTAQAEWDKQIKQHIAETERQVLTQRIDEVLKQVEDAEAAFVKLRDIQLGKADEAVKQAEQAAAKAQKELADRQKELSQLPTQIQAAEKTIGNLRKAVKDALDARDWSKAFAMNYRLHKAIAAAKGFFDPDDREATLVNALDEAGQDVEDAQKAVKQAKQDLEHTKNLLKAAEQAYKEKQAGLEAAIASFLKGPAQLAQAAVSTSTTGAP
jgi:predicted  nucleic acid-binding Zn-ribbon protein